jgi:DNA topoisomerase-1
MRLILVESPTKARTIKKFLGQGYRVAATMGHIRDLPKNSFGIEIEKNFKPKYIVIKKARGRLKELKEICRKAKMVVLGTDEDREGEAIAWHLTEALNLNGKKPYQRIVFHEITKGAIEKALKNPRKIDMNLVNSQQARRILDRIVGYKLSPFLWKKVARGLSAGRVQSVAVRLVVEREREIEKFTPQEYWLIEALLKKAKDKKAEAQIKNKFKALLVKKNGKTIPKPGIKTKKEAEKILKDLKGAEYKISKVTKKEIKRNPLPPFVTSALQQEAWKKFHWPAKLTMRIAQDLYERGFITYHRTDSLNLSDSSLFSAKKFIIENYGKNYWAGFLRKYKTKTKGAQEAHEAIRPTRPDFSPQNLEKGTNFKDKNSERLYDLIWRRFIASQMSQAIFDATKIDILAKNYTFRANGQILKFDGFLKIYPIKYKEEELPPLKEGELLELVKLLSSQHFTQPPPRYTEATLIKVLEENGIGRPSTYAPILATIQERNYVQKDQDKRFRPTEIGIVVNDLLVKHFPNIFNIEFTAKMEERLDQIAQGKEKWQEVIKKFYFPFENKLNQKYKEVSKEKIAQEKTEKICPKCGAPLIIRLGRFGRFLACSKFPKCKYTEPLEEKKLGIKCPKCKTGEIVEKRTKNKKVFYGCNRFPKCDFALWDKPTDKTCPKCGSLLVEKGRKIKCSKKECDYQEPSINNA